MGLEGARYHFQELQARLTAEGMRTLWNEKSVTEERRRQLQSDVNQFHWHLRAFLGACGGIRHALDRRQ